MQKFLTRENDEQAQTAIHQLTGLAEQLNEILADLSVQTAFVPTLEVLRSVIIKKNNEPFLKGVNTVIDKNIAVANIKGTLLRDNLKAGQIFYTEATLQAIKDACNHPGRRYFEYLSMEDGKLVLSDDSKTTIRESFRIYVETETGKRFHDLHAEAAAKLTELAQFVDQNTGLRFIMPVQFVTSFFVADDNKKFSPRFIEHENILRSFLEVAELKPL